jgi:integrase
MMDIDARINQANGRLKAARVGVAIERIGGKLRLRATLPPRPGASQSEPHQQRLTLGIAASVEGVKQAESRAREIGALLTQGRFDWLPYVKNDVQPQTCEEWVERFEQDYFQKRKRTHKTETTWKGDYAQVFSTLPAAQPLTISLIERLIKATEPDSKKRQRYCMAMKAIAKFADLDYDPSPLAGNYSPASVAHRDLPGDELITQWFYEISSPSWRWVYGMMATYGLRNHEVFKLDFDQLRTGDPILSVLPDTKTNAREIWACYPEWVEQFDLCNVQIPDIKLDRPNQAIGGAVTKAFACYQVPFTPYDLRHCWAIRTLMFGMDYGMSALQMGHSVAVHKATYHRWITRDHLRGAYTRVMLHPDRPKPPSSPLTELELAGKKLDPTRVQLSLLDADQE